MIADGRAADIIEARASKRRADWLTVHCEYCGTNVVVSRGDRKHCGAVACRKAHAARMQRERGYTRESRKRNGLPESTKAANARRQKRLAECKVERFLHSEIFERDGWTCGICHEPVDHLAVYPDPSSVSLDHVVPIALGGDHVRANVRCAHLGCNVRRGAGRDARTRTFPERTSDKCPTGLAEAS